MIFTRRKSIRIRESLNKKIADLEQRLTIATECLDKIAQGNFDLKLNGALDKHTNDEKEFVDMLQRLSGKLREYSSRETQRSWTAEGVTRFMDLARGDSSARSDFHDRIVSFLVKYVGANQGGLFLLNDETPDDPFLEMTACYAYSKKKFMEKRVDIGQGLLGQCFLEKETARYTQIPDSYVTITSGLGEATPAFLLIVPVKYNEEVVGVLELAAFEKMDRFKVEFVERVAENIASVMVNIKHARKVEKLFQESQEKARILEEREEELRQNFEELVATQEEMKRSQLELDRQASLLKLIVDNIPFPVFVKDETGKYALVNKAEAKLFNLPEEQILGKDDSHFVAQAEEWKVIQESDAKVMSSDAPVELPIQHFTTGQGSSFIFKTTKVPFTNTITGKRNILGVSLDLTEKISLEKKLLQEQTMTATHMLINVIGRQRMLSQKIAFYSETLMRGKVNVEILNGAIELFDHSMNVIRFGGTPMGIPVDKPLPPADPELVPHIQKIEQAWEPYKKAARSIISNSEKGSLTTQPEAEASMCYVEEHAEPLLQLNNDLMLACLKVSKGKA